MNMFSFEQLSNANSLDITPGLQRQVQEEAEACFPDDEGVTYVINRGVESNGRRYVEVSPQPPAGYDSLVFELTVGNAINRCFAYEDGEYGLLFD